MLLVGDRRQFIISIARDHYLPGTSTQVPAQSSLLDACQRDRLLHVLFVHVPQNEKAGHNTIAPAQSLYGLDNAVDIRQRLNLIARPHEEHLHEQRNPRV